MDKEQEWGKGWQKGHGGDDDEDYSGQRKYFQREIGQEHKDKLSWEG